MQSVLTARKSNSTSSQGKEAGRITRLDKPIENEKMHVKTIVTRAIENTEETLIVDRRSGVRPAQHVERKVVHLLKNALLPMSYIRVWNLSTCRRHC